MVGSMMVHTIPSIGNSNDPNDAPFQENIPAGYLKCDGSVLNARDFQALSRVLGVGDNCRFRKEGQNLRNEDLTTGDLGQFQLPDLGSKVIAGGRSSGTYNNYFVDTGTPTFNENRVGPQVEVISNFGDQIEASYIGNMSIAGQPEIDMLGAPRYNLARSTSETELDITNYQGHAHNSAQKYLNHQGNHEVAGIGGKDGAQLTGNSGAYHRFDYTQLGGGTSVHKHNLNIPTSYNHNFKYGFNQTEVDMSQVNVTVDADTANINKIDELMTPFIIVQYLIKF